MRIFHVFSISKPFAMKKLFLLILILPFVSWAQVDSLKLEDSISKYDYANWSNKNFLFVINGAYCTIQDVRILHPDNIENIEIFKNQGILHHTTKDVLVITTKDSDYNTDYDLAVLDLGYENFLKMQPSAETYSLSYLQNRNQRYVSLWNQRVLTGDPDIYEMAIDYDSENFYGLEFEHKLYMFFKFMEKKHSTSML